MAQINLTEEEKLQIIDALNQGLEPSPELLPKVFPRTAEKFDVVALDRAKIPTLEYAGKRTKAAILAEGSAGIGAAPLQTVRCFGDTKEDEWKNLIVQGDNLQFLKTCYKNTDPLIKDKVKGKVKLVYIDPPFGTGDEYGGSDGATSYSAKTAGAEFVEAVRERLFFLKEMLDDTGNIIVRIDYHFGHYIKLVMDEVFGADCFRNEIVINRFKRQQKGLTKLNVGTDSLFYYCKNKENVFFNEQERSRLCSFCGQEKDPAWHAMISSGLRNPPERTILGRRLLPPKGQHWKYIQEKINDMELAGRIRVNERASYTDLEGNRVQGVIEFLQTEDETVDNNWTDLRGYAMNASYPTENHEELLERVIKMTTEKDDLVMDVFGGSGTTGAVAEKLNRKWVMCDFGKHSIYTMQKRIVNISSSKALTELENQVFTANTSKKYNKNPKTFCVISAGAYDFSHVMDLRKNKDHYIDFVLGLFQFDREDQKTIQFKLPNIYALKDNNPVEVYPVWDDVYLKNIRIDIPYLQSIIDHYGGKLKGTYYIITPESCTNTGDITLKNQDNKDVNFVIKSFPYKILEDISHKFVLQEQPVSAKKTNQLINSTSFYFSEDVLITAVKSDKGIKISEFETKILDPNGKRFPGNLGLAMILVDFNYNASKPFDMDLVIFADELTEEGLIKLDKIPESIGIIAIDKHGNESKPYKVK